ncbi:PH domain-containing protein [Bacillus massiliglaciei]|uniref:PH domain-containing protein n=1 Tax=Bacillus massiliglaciei TaxID=1816693 RepID=UPI000DA63F02|nr:PH domain-containing protein [Bacillus massiliglaciei]
MVFTSRKDRWMGFVIWSLITAFIWFFYQSAFVQIDILGIIITIIMIYLLGSIWFITRYKIENDTLKILYGPIKSAIDIQEITFIRNTVNPFAAPSLSVHRIEIHYGKYKTIQISPDDIQAFINELQRKNPHIQLDH